MAERENATPPDAQRAAGVGQFFAKTCIVAVVVSACTIFVMDWIVSITATKVDELTTRTTAKWEASVIRTLANVREQWAETPLGGAGFWTKMEDEIDRMAEPSNDLPAERKQKLTNNVRTIIARWRPLIDAAQAEMQKQPPSPQ